MAVNKNKDSAGDSKSQITIFTNRIKYLTNHLKENRKDHSARRGLVDLVSKRKKMLNYLKGRDVNAYELLIKELGIRK